jgi:hypothetical protein
MRILMLAENDPAGTLILFSRAVNALTGHHCRVATKETRYNCEFGKDLHLPDLNEAGIEELGGLFEESDVFHFHMTADEHTSFGPFRPADFMDGKVVVHHHHGHPDFRSNPGKYRDKYERLDRGNLLVSTPDLLELLPGAVWQPNLVPVRDPAYTPSGSSPDGRFKAAHSPTRRDLKNTEDFLSVMEKLAGRGLPVSPELIEMDTHRGCLERKRASHACFDHMQGYFGMSSLEALSQGLPVIAGLSRCCEEHIEEFTDARELPWLKAENTGQLETVLTRLALDEDFRAAKGRESREFMLGRWNEERVLQRLNDFYRSRS